MSYYLYTRGKDNRITLHVDSCHLRTGRYRVSQRWTGPLSVEEIAILPISHYFLCNCIKAPGQETRSYGPRRVRSGQWKAKPAPALSENFTVSWSEPETLP